MIPYSITTQHGTREGLTIDIVASAMIETEREVEGLSCSFS